MINVYGTSHVSEDSLELIEEKVREHDPDIIALELDYARLNALLRDERQDQGPLFLRLMRFFQESIGSKTGVMPGEEMLYAYQVAINEGRDIGLIDQDISVTIQNLRQISRKEKVKAAAHLLVGALLPFEGFDIHSIPEEDFIDELLQEMRFKFPEMYQVLVEDRNWYMAEALKQLQRDNPDADIVAFVGAAHRREVAKMLEDGVN